jgi:NAD(P)-dependent dehydrogenase (short-subunit alcohol dehydrogenase family)
VVLAGFQVLIGVELFWVVWRLVGSKSAYSARVARSQIQAAAETAIAGGGVDVVFNNAGYGLAGPLEGLTDEQIMRMVNTNMMGTIRTTKAFIPYFRSRRAGLFINTTSIGGLVAVPLLTS